MRQGVCGDRLVKDASGGAPGIEQHTSYTGRVWSCPWAVRVRHTAHPSCILECGLSL